MCMLLDTLNLLTSIVVGKRKITDKNTLDKVDYLVHVVDSIMQTIEERPDYQKVLDAETDAFNESLMSRLRPEDILELIELSEEDKEFDIETEIDGIDTAFSDFIKSGKDIPKS